MNCEFCGEPMVGRTYQGGTPKRFCSRKCRRADQHKRYDERYPDKRRARQSVYDKSPLGRAVQIRKREQPDFPEKRDARDAVRRAIANGDLVRPTKCDNCRTEGRTEAHHYCGYEFSLKVTWLCPKCHRNSE